METVANTEMIQSIMQAVKMTAMAVLGRNTLLCFFNFDEITRLELSEMMLKLESRSRDSQVLFCCCASLILSFESLFKHSHSF